MLATKGAKAATKSLANAPHIIAISESMGFKSKYTSLSYTLDRSSLILYMATTNTNKSYTFSYQKSSTVGKSQMLYIRPVMINQLWNCDGLYTSIQILSIVH